ncbi:MAG: ECF transporter S component [Treponema sp.]|nr:ECF transporter S component [Treponema sp.]
MGKNITADKEAVKDMTVNKRLALISAFSALVVVLGATRLGFISLSPTVSLTIIHIPVILAAFLAGVPGGLVTGAAFGIFSLIQAAMSPAGALGLFFVNPLVSIVPRMLFGAAAGGLYKLCLLVPHLPRTVAATVAAFISSAVHTCLVIGAIYLFYYNDGFAAMGNRGYGLALVLLLPHAGLEAAAAAVVCGVVIGTITLSGKKRSKLSEEK